MNKPLSDPLEFLAQLRAAIKDKYPVREMEDRACVITRSPAYYGKPYSTIIEWVGSPPKFSIYYGSCLVISGVKVKAAHLFEARSLIEKFLAEHPANDDDSPVWIGTRWKDRT